MGLGGREENRLQRCFFVFRGKRHDNKILKVLILLPRNFARAPTISAKLSPNFEKFTDELLREQGECIADGDR